jgi:hypothetical protein
LAKKSCAGIFFAVVARGYVFQKLLCLRGGEFLEEFLLGQGFHHLIVVVEEILLRGLLSSS